MKAYLIPGLLGLATGLALRWTGFHRPGALKDMLGLRRSHALRSGLYALGWAMLLAAGLCWLAVIDVDRIEVLPLNGSVAAGALIFGTAAGLSGFTPFTVPAGVGSPALPEALCTAAGCLAATLLLPLLEEPLAALRSAGPSSAATLFRMTLDEPWLLEGGFLGQGCVGLVLMSIAVCLPSPRIAEDAAPTPAPDPDPPLPEDAPEETFVALLPGEEPLIVDTELDDASDEAPAPEDPEDVPSDEPSGDDPPPDTASG